MKTLLLFLMSCFFVAYAKDVTRVDINVDDSIQKQYETIIGNRLPALQTFIETLLGIFGNQTQSSYDSLVANQPKDWISRIEAVANITGYQPKDIALCGLFYELMAYGCTSIVINNGTEIFMGRNLDFNFINFNIPNLMFEGRYYKNNKLLFIGQGFIGDPGLLNGVKIGQFALSIDLRSTSGNLTAQVINVGRAYQGKISPTYNILLMLMNMDNYTSLLAGLQGVQLTTECYYIACGINKNEGVIITRSGDSVVNVDTLDMDNGKYYLVQTNADREVLSDTRRRSAESRLDEMKKNNEQFTYQNVYDEVMSKFPNKSPITIYSTIQSPANGGYAYTNVWSSGTFLQGTFGWGIIWIFIIIIWN